MSISAIMAVHATYDAAHIARVSEERMRRLVATLAARASLRV